MAPLADLLSVRPVERDRAEAECLTGATGRIFGGQVAAQVITAAAQMCDGQRRPQSLHAHFLRPGDPEQLVNYQMTALKEGRALSVYRVDAIQGKSVILTATVSFHTEESSPEFQDPMPVTIPADQCEPRTYIPQGTNPGVREPVEFRWPDTRAIDEMAMPPNQLTWFKSRTALPDDPVIHAAALTYISDLTLTRTAHMPLRDEMYHRVGASLDHNLWFYNDLRADQWMLFDQHTSVYHGARAMSYGHLFGSDGKLAAFISQEALIRRNPKE